MNRPQSTDSTSSSFDDTHKWRAFGVIGISLVTMVMSMSMVFEALAAIADDFGVTLGAVSWVVIAQALTICALMMPMGRLADMIGWKRVHLIGLALFAGGAVFIAIAPTFEMLIVARVVMAVGNAMGQSVGTAMVVSVFPPEERGKAVGSQTTAVAIGGVSGPILGGLILEVLPWEALFYLLVTPIAIAFIGGYLVLDENRMRREPRGQRAPFDWGGAIISGLAITLLVITINNPLGQSWTSPGLWLALAAVVLLFYAFARWELRVDQPMVDLRLFNDPLFSLAVVTRLLGFMGMSATMFMMPIFLISYRGISEGSAGGVLFLTSFGMGLAGYAAGRLSDLFGPRRFTILGLTILIATVIPMALLQADTPIAFIMFLLLANGIGAGIWNVPNNSMILGLAPASSLGVVAALTNLTRNLGNVFGQAVTAGVVVAVMAAQGFDIPLSVVRTDPGAGEAFLDGWRAAFTVVAVLCAVGAALAVLSRPPTHPPAG